MRVLFLDQFSELGGAQRCLLDLIDGLACSGLHAAVPAGGPLVPALAARGVTVHELPPSNYGNGYKTPADLLRFTVDTPRLASRIAGLVRKHAADLVYVNGPRLLPAASLATRGPLIFHAHNYLGKRYSSTLARWSLRRANARVIACCRFVARVLPHDRLRVIYNGVRELPFAPPAARKGRRPRVGMLGRIAPEKGQLDFVHGARILTERGAGAEFHIYGSALFSDASYLDRVRASSGSLPITFEGWSTNIAAAFANLDVLAVPSSAIDATPRVILEAFSAGVPVVAYRSGGIPELIEHGSSGILTASPTPEALAAAIGELLAHPARISAIVSAARARWQERFTVQRYAREIATVMEVQYTRSPISPA